MEEGRARAEEKSDKCPRKEAGGEEVIWFWCSGGGAADAELNNRQTSVDQQQDDGASVQDGGCWSRRVDAVSSELSFLCSGENM